jgi:hypothetical protein
MRWLEIIKIQSAIGKESTVKERLQALNQNIPKHPDNLGLVEVTIYHHASVPGFFVIYLKWDTENAQTLGSLVGLNLSQTLKAFGLVDHSVWTEIKNIEKT